MKLVPNFMFYKLIVLIAIGTALLQQSAVIAQEKGNPSAISFGTAFEPPNKDKPVATSGGASRGQQCIVDLDNSEVPIIPILPAINQRLTTTPYPTFFIHIPQTSARKIFFQIEDENEENSYQTIMPITGNPGILRITLPQDAPPLEVGKNYQWALALICDQKLRPDSPIVQGSIIREQSEIELNQQLQSMTLIEQASFYAKSGIWYEAIEILAKLTEDQPNNPKFKSIWHEVLSSIGLNNIAQAEFVE